MFGATLGAIEIAYDRVRVAVVKTGGKLPVVLELAERATEFESAEERVTALGRALGDALDSLQARPQAYVLCSSAMYTVVRTLSIPFRGARRVAAAVPFEMEPYLAFPIEELAVDFTTIGEFNGETEVLAMGMRRAQLDEQLDILREAGIDTDAVTLDALALTGLWTQVAKPGKGLEAVLHLREDGAMLAVVHKQRMAYFRVLSTTPATLVENPAIVAREVNNTLRAFLSKWRGEGDITRLHLTGIDLAHEQREAFAAALGLPVDDLVLIAQLQGGALALEGGPGGGKANRWEPLVGAALAAAGNGFLVDFSADSPQGNAPVRTVITHVLFTACIALILLAGWSFYYYQGRIQNEAQARDLQAQVEQIQTEISALTEQGIQDVDMTIFEDPTLLDILQEIAAKLPNDRVQILEIKITPPGGRGGWITVSGTANDAASFNQAYDQLRASTLFRVDEQPNIAVQGTQTTFSFRANRIQEEEETPAP